MTRQDWLRKWCAYALALFPIWLLDAFVLSRWAFFGVSALLLPVAVTAVGTLEGITGGMGFGLGAGLLWVAAYPGGQSYRVLLLTLVGLAAGALAQYVLSQTFLGCFVASAAILAVLECGRAATVAIAAGAAPGALLRVCGLQFVWSLCWTPVVYGIFYRVFCRVGGSRLS